MDDEPLVLSVLRGMLLNRGYEVLSALNAEQALGAFEGHSRRIDLLLADVIMPGMSGPELAAELLARQPDLRILFIAGMPDSDQIQHLIIDRGFDLLPKPFMPAELLRRIGDVLGEQRCRMAAR